MNFEVSFSEDTGELRFTVCTHTHGKDEWRTVNVMVASLNVSNRGWSTFHLLDIHTYPPLTMVSTTPLTPWMTGGLNSRKFTFPECCILGIIYGTLALSPPLYFPLSLFLSLPLFNPRPPSYSLQARFLLAQIETYYTVLIGSDYSGSLLVPVGVSYSCEPMYLSVCSLQHLAHNKRGGRWYITGIDSHLYGAVWTESHSTIEGRGAMRYSVDEPGGVRGWYGIYPYPPGEERGHIPGVKRIDSKMDQMECYRHIG